MKNSKTIIDMKNVAAKIGNFIDRNLIAIICIILLGVMCNGVASATTPPDAESLWGEVATLIETWVTRLGAVIMFVGGVMFGLGWKNDDANQKSSGISTLVAGAIVIAVAQLASTFFA